MDKGTQTKHKGISRLATGEWLVRVRGLDKTTGKMKDAARKLVPTTELKDVLATQISLREALNPTAPEPSRTRFAEYARKVMNDRIALGKIASPESKIKWDNVLKLHLERDWGETFIDAITRHAVERWLVGLGKDLQAKRFTPSTLKTWWAVFRTIMSRAAIYFDMKDPTALVELPTSTHRTYTVEEPNSLLPDELPVFFEAAWNHEREHFAMLALGALTGRRACELRPLRRQGRLSDLNWETGRLIVRRSQTKGAPMEQTKQKQDVVLFLPPTVMDILRTHVANLTPFRKESDLLFPPRHWLKDKGAVTYMSKSALDKPIKHICEKAGIKKHLTAKGAMRRTYQDLCRAASVNQTVQMAMSGHATVEMMELYSSASADEKRSAIYRMSEIAGLPKAARL